MPTANANGYTQGNSYVTQAGLARTNPYAESENAERLYGLSTMHPRHSVAFTWRVTSAGDAIIFTPSTGATTATDYLRFAVYDKEGGEARTTAFQSSAATTALTVNTSSLQTKMGWFVIFETANNSGASTVSFQFEIGEAKIVTNSSAPVAYTLT
jgi:hypothetical protein